MQDKKATKNKNGLDELGEGLQGPKFSEYGAKPGSKYTHIGLPPKYIVAVVTADEVIYAQDRVQEFIKEAQKGAVEVEGVEQKYSSEDEIDWED